MKENKRILFVGDLNEYGRSFQRFLTFRRMGHYMVGVSTVPVPFRPGIEKSGFLEKVFWKLRIPLDITSANKKIKEETKKNQYDIIWIEKGISIYPSTLLFIKKTLPNSKLIFCSEDDMYAKHNRTYYFDKGLCYYDMVYTTKVYNLTELRGLGAKQTRLFLDSYDETTHRPIALSREEKKKYLCDVSFIGSFEGDRAEKISFLADNGIEVVVWGTGWGELVGRYENILVKNTMLFGDEYAKAMCGTKINLCFLRKINRDEVTSRSVEIPACRGFMLGERTGRHKDFFEEGKEAEFFGSNEELLEKVRYYLAHEDKRRTIAEAGFARCLRSGYSMREQLEKMLLL